MSEYMLGVDIGTSSCKVSIIDLEGNVVGNSFKRYKTYYPRVGWAEQRPEDWYEAFKYALKDVFEKKNLQKKDIVSIGIDGMMNSPVFLDKNGDVIRPTIIWVDQRSTVQAKRLKKILKNNIVFNGPITSTELLSKILWVKENQPKTWEEIWKILTPKDFVRSKLINSSFVTDWSDASATCLFDVEKLSWSDEVCQSVGINKSKLPEAISSIEVVGRVSKKAANELGIIEGIPVITGCADAAADNLTAGVIYPNQCLIRIGTCGALFMITDKVSLYQKNQYYVIVHCIPGLWINHLVTPAGFSKEWFQQNFLNNDCKPNNDFLDTIASKVSAGSQGLIFHPYISGEHTPRASYNLKGSFVGITSHHKKAHFSRAILEGVAFSIKECFEIFEEINPEIKSVRAVGGGFKSPLWREIITNVLGVEVEVLEFGDASYGAGLLGGIGVGIFKNPQYAVEKCIKINEVLKVNATIHKKYKKIFKLYTETLDKLQDISWA